jgi:ArsR family transcriptional regulator
MKTTDVKRSSACCGGLKGLLSPKLFKALSDPTRLSLLVRLAEACEPCTVGVVANGSGVDMSVVSRHLGILRDAGILRCEKRGKEVLCAVDTSTVVKFLRDVADALEACCPHGCALDVAAPKTRAPRATGPLARTGR